jgi:cyclic pyranopterin phosphate synthase
VKEDIFEKELSTLETKKLAKKLAKLGILYISIGGGEPLLREDIVEVVRIFINHGIKVRLLTNGVILTRSLLYAFKKAGLKDISISLDTLDREKFKFITGKDLLYKVIDSIELVNEILSRGIWLINCVVSRLNYQEVPQILDLAKKMNFLVSLIPIENPQGEFLFLRKDYREIDKLFEILMSRKEVIFNSRRFLIYLKHYLKSQFLNFPCYAGELYFSISPDGNFNICHRYGNNLKLKYNCSGCLRPCWREWDIMFTMPSNLLQKIKFYLLK